MQTGKPFGWCIVVATGIGIQCYLFGGFSASARAKMFNKEFFEKKFPTLPKNDRNSGNPDMGNGKYAEKLSLEEWHELNCAVRASSSYTEVVYLPILTTIISGLVYPHASVCFGIVYMIGRTLYSFGYYHRGPNGRKLGAIISDFSLLGLCITSLLAGWKMGGEKDGFITMTNETLSFGSKLLFGWKSNSK